MKTHIRWLDLRHDMADVLEADNYGFGEERILQCLRQRNCIGMVIEVGDQVVGFMLYELRKNTLKLLRLCVKKEWQGMGIGEALMDRPKKLQEVGV